MSVLCWGLPDPPSLALDLLCDSENGILLAPGAKSPADFFFLHQTIKAPTNYVFLKASIRIQARPKSEFQAFVHTLSTGAIADGYVQN